jgi:hypothetical protein
MSTNSISLADDVIPHNNVEVSFRLQSSIQLEWDKRIVAVGELFVSIPLP